MTCFYWYNIINILQNDLSMMIINKNGNLNYYLFILFIFIKIDWDWIFGIAKINWKYYTTLYIDGFIYCIKWKIRNPKVCEIISNLFLNSFG